MITLNAPGARTLADAHQWFVDGQGIYVTFSDDAAHLHLRGRIVADRPAAEITGDRDAQEWAVAYLAAETERADAELAEFVAHVDATEAVKAVREQGAEMLAEADVLAALGTGPVKYPRTRNGQRSGTWTCHYSDPRHPAHQAVSIRETANRLINWTNADEVGYHQYVSDGLADTDGVFAPVTRQAWAWLGE